MELLVQVDHGTDYQVRCILNPIFILLVNSVMANIEATANLFGLRREKWQSLKS